MSEEDRCGPIDFCIGLTSIALKIPESEMRAIFNNVAGGTLITTLVVGGCCSLGNTYISPQIEKPTIVEYKDSKNYDVFSQCRIEDQKPFCLDEKVFVCKKSVDSQYF